VPFRWSESSCGRHFKLMDAHIVAMGKGGTSDISEEIEPGIWSGLSKSAQAVLPVLIRHADVNGKARPGEERIAAMSGLLDRKSVRKATKVLADSSVLEITKITTRSGNQVKQYKLSMLTNNGTRGRDTIRIPSIQIDGGNWARLLPSAKSLAVAFWFFSKTRPDMDPAIVEDESVQNWLEGDDFYEYAEQREFDFCSADPSVLRDFAGISARAYSEAIKSLRNCHIIKDHPWREDGWHVYVWPPKVTKVSYLNEHYGDKIW
jgi:hypothetical protein